MATVVWDDASFVINSVDLSAHVNSISFSYSADEIDETAMGDDTHVRKGGLKDWQFDVNFNEDFASGAVDATVFSLIGTTTTVVVKPTSGSVSTTNPSFTGTALINGRSFGGSVGSLLTGAITCRAAGDLTRATS